MRFLFSVRLNRKCFSVPLMFKGGFVVVLNRTLYSTKAGVP